jgi:Ca-activated chloride channel homolog
MTFAYPELLLLVLALAAALWRAAALARGRRASLPFPVETGALPSRTSFRTAAARWAPLALPAAAALLLIAALARPQRVRSRLAGLGRGIDIMMTMDTSLSMGALDFDPHSRSDAAKDTARRFVLGRVADRIGLVQFGGAAVLGCPLTVDYDALLGRLAELEPGMTRIDGTAIGDGLISAINHLKKSDGKSKIVILLTDGRSNAGLIDPLTAAKAARAFGIRIYAIGCGKRGESVMPLDDPQRGRMLVRISDDLDDETLAEIARIGDGKYFRATSLKELRDVYAEIDRLEKSDVKLPETVSRDDLYRTPAALALLLLLAEAVLSSTWLLRWP